MCFCTHYTKSSNSLYINQQIFTAAEQEYADAIINHIDPSHLFSYRLYRDSCIERNGNAIKDLRIVVNRSLQHSILVDNCTISFLE